jgi:hypothetical protein
MLVIGCWLPTRSAARIASVVGGLTGRLKSEFIKNLNKFQRPVSVAHR